MLKRVVWMCVSACVVFSAVGQENLPVGVVGVQKQECQGFKNIASLLAPSQPLDLQAVQHAVYQVKASQPLLEREWGIVIQFGDYLRANLSPDNLAFLEELIGRARQQGIEAAEVDFFLLALESEQAD